MNLRIILPFVFRVHNKRQVINPIGYLRKRSATNVPVAENMMGLIVYQNVATDTSKMQMIAVFPVPLQLTLQKKIGNPQRMIVKTVVPTENMTALIVYRNVTVDTSRMMVETVFPVLRQPTLQKQIGSPQRMIVKIVVPTENMMALIVYRDVTADTSRMKAENVFPALS